MYGSMEQSTAAAAPALGPEEVKFVRKLMATNGDDARSAGLSHESQASSASTLPTLATQALSALRCSRRCIQISTLFAAKREDAATRAACRRTSGTARTRSGIKFAF